MPYVESYIEIEGAPSDVYRIAADMEKYPDFMPDVRQVTTVEREGNRTVTEWEASVEGTPIFWTEEDIFDETGMRIVYRLVEGDFDKWEGEWRFDSIPGGTRVTLTVDFDFGIPNLTELIGPTLEVKVRENSESMLTGMKRHVESLRQLT